MRVARARESLRRTSVYFGLAAERDVASDGWDAATFVAFLVRNVVVLVVAILVARLLGVEAPGGGLRDAAWFVLIVIAVSLVGGWSLRVVMARATREGPR